MRSVARVISSIAIAVVKGSQEVVTPPMSKVCGLEGVRARMVMGMRSLPGSIPGQRELVSSTGNPFETPHLDCTETGKNTEGAEV